MWIWLLPYFIPVICVMGPHGMLVPGLVGPIETEDDVKLMEMYLRYEAGCETGPVTRMFRWKDAAPAEPLYPQYWKNLQLQDGPLPQDVEGILRAFSKLAWRRP